MRGLALLSERVMGIAPSATMAVSNRAKMLKAQGVEVVDFGAGEPDFDTPEHVKQAAVKALQEGFTKYTPSTGIPELKKAICEKLRRENDVAYQPDQVVVSCGAKHCLFNIMQAMLGPGDEVLIPAPYWVSYLEQVRLAQARPVLVKGAGLKVTPEDIKEKLTERTKMLILNSPNNPSGEVYTRRELEAIAELALSRWFYVVSDEVYEKFVYEGRHWSIASLNEAMKDLTITVNGASKTYAMTGWRIGYMAGPSEIMEACSRLQDHTTSNPNSIAQRAALAALTGPQDRVAQMVKEFDRRRQYMVERLNVLNGISCPMPNGAFYAFPNVDGLLGKTWKTSEDLTLELLQEAKVAVVPGSAFGLEGHIRLSYATSMENIEKGLNQIEAFLSS